jgi:hypothetical protein
MFRLVINSVQVVTGLTPETVACNHASNGRVMETPARWSNVRLMFRLYALTDCMEIVDLQCIRKHYFTDVPLFIVTPTNSRCGT